MSKLLLATAGAALVAATPALAADADTSTQWVHDRASWFEAADTNDNDFLSRAEFRNFRFNTIAQGAVGSYRADMRPAMGTIVDRSFARLDLDNNDMISTTEFANAPTLLENRATSSSAMNTTANATANTGTATATNPTPAMTWWDPAYVTATYYLTINKVDADELQGKQVVNLEGEPVGKIERIVRTKEDNRYYAMLDLRGVDLVSRSIVPRDTAGVPLDDVLLFRDGKSIMLSTRGEEYLRNADARVIENYETVDSLYQL